MKLYIYCKLTNRVFQAIEAATKEECERYFGYLEYSDKYFGFTYNPPNSDGSVNLNEVSES